MPPPPTTMKSRRAIDEQTWRACAGVYWSSWKSRLDLAAAHGVTGLVPEDLRAGLERVVRERRAGAGQWRVDADVDRAGVDAGRAAVMRRAARRRCRPATLVPPPFVAPPLVLPPLMLPPDRCPADRSRSGRSARNRAVGAGAGGVGPTTWHSHAAAVALRTDAACLQRRGRLRLEPTGGGEQGRRRQGAGEESVAAGLVATAWGSWGLRCGSSAAQHLVGRLRRPWAQQGSGHRARVRPEAAGRRGRARGPERLGRGWTGRSSAAATGRVAGAAEPRWTPRSARACWPADVADVAGGTETSTGLLPPPVPPPRAGTTTLPLCRLRCTRRRAGAATPGAIGDVRLHVLGAREHELERCGRGVRVGEDRDPEVLVVDPGLRDRRNLERVVAVRDCRL